MSLTLIETKTVGAGGATVIEFNNISANFTDLFLVRSMLSDGTAGPAMSANITFNNSSTGYSEKILYNNASGGSASGNRSGAFFDWVGLTNASGTGTSPNVFGSASFYIANYRSSNAKSVSSEAIQEANNSSGAYWNHYIVAGSWSGTDPITSIKFTSSSGNFVAGSTASLYGIKSGSAIVQPKAIGGTTITSGGYVYHVFRESGTFVALQSLNADVLMIGGGGGGGFSYGLGGGAGTVAATYNQTLSGAKTVVVGYGGGPGYYNNGNGGNGYNGGATTFTGLPTAAGGAGGPQGGWNGGNGAGSGPSGQNGGAGTYGFASWATATGTGYDNGFYGGGGGGGGYESYGMGGIGGGGNGGAYALGMYGGNNGVYNTGSGGGGGYSGSGAGGSGLVIVRYLI